MRGRHPVSSHTTFLWAGLLALLPLAPAMGQQRELSIELGGSSVKPPSGIEGAAAQFAVAGIRAFAYDMKGSGFMAAFQTGRSLKDGSGGDFLSGMLEGSFWRYFAPGWSAGVEARGFGFDVVDPVPYRALGLEGGPSIRFSGRNLSAAVKGIAGTGWSRTDLLPYSDRPAAVLEEDLWRYGGSAEVLVGSGKVMGGLAAGVHESPGGTYRSWGGRVLLSGFGPVVQLMVDRWRTPVGTETTGGVALVLPLGGWSLRGFLGRTEPDPLTLTEPGGGAGGVMIGRRLLGSDPSPAPRPFLHEVLNFEGSQALVRIRTRVPRGTEGVEIMGDFTFWEPVLMKRDGSVWVVELSVPEGTHHFGFLVDGEWFLPDDAPDTVADDWGRKNATLVIER